MQNHIARKPALLQSEFLGVAAQRPVGQGVSLQDPGTEVRPDVNGVHAAVLPELDDHGRLFPVLLGLRVIPVVDQGLVLAAEDIHGDGLPDYVEDRDGDGTVDTGESNWQQSENGTTGTAGLQVFTPLE